MNSLVDGMYFIRNASDATILYETPSDITGLKVLDDSKYRWIQTKNNCIQSAMRLSANWQLVLPYYPGLLSALLFKQDPENIFLIGLGGGELARYLNHCLPQARLTALEKNQDIIKVFQAHFNPDNIQIDIINADICHWQMDNNKPYDLVVLDVYGDKALPDCLYEEALYQQCYKQLSDDGILAANLAVKDEQEAVLILTKIRKVFNQHVMFLSVEDHSNLIVLAFKKALHEFDRELLRSNVDSLQNKFAINFKGIAEELFANNEKLI